MSKKLLIVENIKINTKVGNEYQVTLSNTSSKHKDSIHIETFKGKLIQETVNFLTFKNYQCGYSESFLKIDFALDYYQLRERRDNGKWTEPLKVKY